MTDNAYEVYQRRGSLVLYLAECILFILVAYIFTKYADIFSYDCSLREFRRCCFTNPVFYELVGRGLYTYFGLSMLVLIFYMIKPSKLFYINDDGFWSRDFGFISWSNVSDIYIDNVSCERVICFELKDEKVLNNPLYITQKIKKFLFGKNYSIGFAGNYTSVDEAYKLMKPHCQNENN